MMKYLLIWLLFVAFVFAGGSGFAANDRPLIFGMNPIPMEWWGYEPDVWNPLQFQKMAEAGCASARVGTGWDLIEPVRGQRDWTDLDKWVNYCLDNNIEPLVLINSTPTWALPDYVDPAVPVPEARYPPAEQYTEDFENWCYDLARRLRGRVRYYEFWNEANGYGWYTPWDPDPAKRFSRADLYTPWMIRAYNAVKLADPACMMSTTGIDDGGEGHAAYFLNLIYTYGGKGYFDAVADHPYPAGAGFQPWKLDQIRNVLDAHGDTHVKVWITEFGYPMNPNDYPAYQQYMTDYFNTLTQDRYNYVRIATWHTAAEFPWEAGYGLMNSDLSPKPPYNTFKNYSKPLRPTISNISITHISPSSVRVYFTTNVPAKAQVMYGPDRNYGSVTARESTGTTSHLHTLVGLSPGTMYHFRVRAGRADIEDTDAFSQDQTFTTTSGPVVNITSGPTVSNITETGAVISWTTDVPATSRVEYGLTQAYGGNAYSSTPTTNHSMQLSGLQSGANYQYRVTSMASGYAAASVEGRPFTTPVAFTGLVNGSFESGIQGWTYWEVYPWGNDNGDDGVDYPGHISVQSNAGVYPPSPAAVDGSWRLTHDVGWASAVGGVYQTVRLPNGTYLVSGWVAMGGDGGTELVELRALDGPYTGGIPGGTVIAGLSESSGWKYYSGPVEVTSEKLTVATRVSQYWAVTAVAGHFDGISVSPCHLGKIGSLKTQTVGDAVAVDGDKIVTMVVDDHTFYIQEDDRSSGIKVRTVSPHGLLELDRVKVSGKLQMVDGELTIDNAYAGFVSTGVSPAPLGVSLRSTGSETGLSNTGLLVKAWGKVTETGTDYVKIDDGGGVAVKCVLPAGVSADPSWRYLAVTGISSVYPDGSQVLPVIIIRKSSDIYNSCKLNLKGYDIIYRARYYLPKSGLIEI